MPNHVDNELLVTGPSEDLLRFMEFAKGPAGTLGNDPGEDLLSAHKFVPMPQEYREGPRCVECNYTQPSEPELGLDQRLGGPCPICGKYMKDGFNRGGWEWCIEHWGTKWGLYDARLEDQDTYDDPEEGGFLNYFFQTAWAPPTPVIQAMATKFPTLAFDLGYWEGGMGFQGKLVMEGGVEASEWSGPYHGSRGG